MMGCGSGSRKAGSNRERLSLLECSLQVFPWPALALHSDLLCVFPVILKNIRFCFTESKRNKEIRRLAETKSE